MFEHVKKLQVLFKSIYHEFLSSYEESKIFVTPFGFLLIVGYLGFYYFNLLFAEPQGYENLKLRIIISILGLGLIFKKYLTPKLEKYFPLYWYFTITFSLPFFFFYMLFHFN